MSTERDKNSVSDYVQGSQENVYNPLPCPPMYTVVPPQFQYLYTPPSFAPSYYTPQFPQQNSYQMIGQGVLNGPQANRQMPQNLPLPVSTPSTQPSNQMPPAGLLTSNQSFESINESGSDVTPPANHRKPKQPVPEHEKNEKYRAKRAKNNLAAQRSRRSRKEKDEKSEKTLSELEVTKSEKLKALNQLKNDTDTVRQKIIDLKRRLGPMDGTAVTSMSVPAFYSHNFKQMLNN